MKAIFAAFALTLLAGGAAQTATAQPASAPAQSLGGPQIPGVCLLSQQAVLANAKVGVAATQRLKQLADAADAEIAAGRQPIQTDAQALQAQSASLKPAELEARRQGLATRVQALQQTADQRRREIEATRQKVLTRIATEAQPVIAAVYKAHGCGLLFDRNTVMGGNMAGDLTAAVVQGLDARITTITFDRESLPAQTASTQ